MEFHTSRKLQHTDVDYLFDYLMLICGFFTPIIKNLIIKSLGLIIVVVRDISAVPPPVPLKNRAVALMKTIKFDVRCKLIPSGAAALGSITDGAYFESTISPHPLTGSVSRSSP